MPLSTASAVFAARGELSFLAELARAAYHLRVDANPIDGIDSNEWTSVLLGVDPAVDPSFAVAGQVLQLMNPSDFGSAGAGLQLDGGLFYTDGLENGIFTTSNAAALVARAADALFISFRGTNDSIDLVEDAFGQFDVHWAKFAALRSALTAFIDNGANGISHVYVTGHSLGASMVEAMMQEHAGDVRFEAATFGSPGYMLGADQPDARITNIANEGDIVSFVESVYRIDGDTNAILEGIGSGTTAHSMNLYYEEAKFLRDNGIDIMVLQGVGGVDYDTILLAAHDNGDNTFSIGSGNDQLNGIDAAEILLGGAGIDTIFAGDGHDLARGGDGNDTLVGNADIFAQVSDILDGGAGDDTIVGEYTDTISGGAGTDALYAANSYAWSIDLGATGIEWMTAGFGSDSITAATASVGVTIYAGGGNDGVTGSGFADIVWAGVGDDTVATGGGNDLIIGEQGVDNLSGGSGDDSLYTDGVDGSLDGGSGADALYIVGGGGLTLDFLASGFEWVGDYAGGSDVMNASLLTVDAVVYAGGGNDIVTGGSGGDFLWGEAGNDGISGAGGNDTVVGGAGSDTLQGGGGNDTIFASSGGGGDGASDVIIFEAVWGADFVYDFEHGLDRLDLHATGATAGTVSISAAGGSAWVQFGGDLIVVVGAAGTFTVADIQF